MNGAKIRGFWDIAVSVCNPFGRDAGPGVRNPPDAREPWPARPARPRLKQLLLAAR